MMETREEFTILLKKLSQPIKHFLILKINVVYACHIYIKKCSLIFQNVHIAFVSFLPIIKYQSMLCPK